jgi:hypothetical protein
MKAEIILLMTLQVWSACLRLEGNIDGRDKYIGSILGIHFDTSSDEGIRSFETPTIGNQNPESTSNEKYLFVQNNEKNDEITW